MFARGVGRSPTALLRLAIDRAAQLEAKAELALADPEANATTISNLTRAARLARRDLERAKVSKREPAKLGPDSLREYAASKYGATP